MDGLKRRRFLQMAAAAAAGPAAAASLSATQAEPVALGFIGVGSRGTYLLLTLLTLPGVRVRAICDIDPAHAEEARRLVVAAGQSEPLLFPEWRKLLENREIRAVVCAIPCHLHARAYLDIIAAGKDLYGEKPMCITRAECDAVVAAASKSDLVIQVGHQRRADPRYIGAMSEVHRGQLGPLIEGRIVWCNPWGPLYGWFGHAAESGDWIVEQAVHVWDVMNWANRCQPKAAMGLGRNDLFRDRQPDRNVHDYYSAVVEYENGVIVNLTHSWVVADKFGEERLRLSGAIGSLDFDSGLMSFRKGTGQPERIVPGFRSGINNTLLALESFLDSVRTRKPPVATVEQARDAVLTCLLVREAVYRRKVVSLRDLRA
jgi:predicted dehydrogenase